MDSGKISKDLGWKKNTNFNDGLNKTVEWYLRNPEIWKDIPSKILDVTPWKTSKKF